MKFCKLRLSETTQNHLRKLHPLTKSKIRAALDAIVQDPNEGKSLKDDLVGLKSYRVGAYRIVYQIKKETIIQIEAIGPRKTIYGDVMKWLGRS